MRVCRPLPKARAAVTIATARTAPSITERTGTAVRRSAGSSARRTPTAPGAGSPAEMITRATFETRAGASRDLTAMRCAFPVSESNGDRAEPTDQHHRSDAQASQSKASPDDG